jgi:hypothetical protein
LFINRICFMFNVKCLLSPFVLYKLFSNFLWLFNIKRIYQRKYFSVKKNLAWFLEKFFFILKRKYFLEVLKILKISCYLLMISNLVFNLLITICFLIFSFTFIFSVSYIRIWFNLIFISIWFSFFFIVIFFSYSFLN